jgi:methionyl-tRNA formyltransferase
VKLVFCGTPQFAVPTLRALHEAGHEIALVVSQPDRPVGRKQIIEPTPVKQASLGLGLQVTQPDKIRNNVEFRGRLEAIGPDAIVVVAYGRIIPQWMLALPRFGCINLHGSLLPKYRGAAPIQWAVAMGETVTGNTTMLLEEGLDTGPMLLQQEVPIGPDQTAVDLFEILAVRGAPLMVETLAGLANGSIQPKGQDHAKATLAPILTRDDGRMDFSGHTATELRNRAVAGCVYIAEWEKANCACDGDCFGSETTEHCGGAGATAHRSKRHAGWLRARNLARVDRVADRGQETHDVGRVSTRNSINAGHAAGPLSNGRLSAAQSCLRHPSRGRARPGALR